MYELSYDEESDVLMILVSEAGKLSHAEEMGDKVAHQGQKGTYVFEVLASKDMPPGG